MSVEKSHRDGRDVAYFFDVYGGILPPNTFVLFRPLKIKKIGVIADLHKVLYWCRRSEAHALRFQKGPAPYGVTLLSDCYPRSIGEFFPYNPWFDSFRLKPHQMKNDR